MGETNYFPIRCRRFKFKNNATGEKKKKKKLLWRLAHLSPTFCVTPCLLLMLIIFSFSKYTSSFMRLRSAGVGQSEKWIWSTTLGPTVLLGSQNRLLLFLSFVPRGNPLPGRTMRCQWRVPDRSVSPLDLCGPKKAERQRTCLEQKTSGVI